MSFLYYAATFLFKTTGTFASQKYSRRTKSFYDIFIYAFITGCIATLFFFIMSGFKIALNAVTLMYSAVFAVVVICGYFASVPVYRFMGVAEVSVFSTAANLTLSYLFGMLFFDEKLDIRAILRFVTMIVCAVFMYIHAKKKTKESCAVTAFGVVLCLVNALVGVAATAISKSFARNEYVTDSNSFFFMTNVFIILFSLVAVFVAKRGNTKEIAGFFKNQSVTSYLLIALLTVSSNVCSLLQILILSQDAINLYVPISGAMGIIAGAIVALVAAKERPPVIPVLLAGAAFFI